jgi:type II secretory pathway pseudopilin PulG
MRLLSQQGALLIEILVAISIFAVIGAIGSQAIVVNLRTITAAAQKDVSAHLLTELLEGVRASTEENWQNIQTLTRGAHYYPQRFGNAWTLTAGDETVTMNGSVYTRYFIISDVSRDQSTHSIESSYNAGHSDPSTIVVEGHVTTNSDIPLSAKHYMFRWRNNVCHQTTWTTSGSSGVKTCPDTTYTSQTNITTGNNLQLCSEEC